MIPDDGYKLCHCGHIVIDDPDMPCWHCSGSRRQTMSEAWADVGYNGAMLISALIPRRLRDAVEPYAPTVGAILALWIALGTVAAITLLLVRA